MAFYCPDAAMGQRLSSLVAAWDAHTPGLSAAVSITWLRYPQAGPALPGSSTDAEATATPAAVQGASWQGTLRRDPAALVRLVYLYATEIWLQQDLLEEGEELRRALQAMVQRASLEATSLVVDLLSGTTSGPSLAPARRSGWTRQRLLVNGWLASLDWPELEGCSATEKLWHDGPYGRDRDLRDALECQGNRFNSEGLARLLQTALSGAFLSPSAGRRLRDLLWQAAPSEVQPGVERAPLADWLRRAIPAGGGLWGLSAADGRHWHQALYGERPGQEPILLVLLCEGDAVATAAEPLQSLSRSLLQGMQAPVEGTPPPPPGL